MRLSKLNGWHRLWCALGVFTLVPLLVLMVVGRTKDPEMVLAFVAIWGFFMVVLYVFGLIIKWVISGFKNESNSLK